MADTAPAVDRPRSWSAKAAQRLDVSSMLIATGCLVVLLYSPGHFIELVPIGLACLALERLMPLHDQRLLRSGLATDIFHIIFTRTIAGIIAGGIGFWIGTAIFEAFKPEVGALRGLPMWALVPLCVLSADLGGYTEHRMSHHFRFLWRFHRIHHIAEDLDWVSFGRIHPVDAIGVQLFEFLPLFILGAPPLLLGIYLMFIQADGYFSHSNTRLTLGPLRWVFSTPEYHRWHHANQKKAYDRNFCGIFPLWDVLFRTVYLPRDERPAVYGVDNNRPLDYMDQIIDPLLPRKPRKAA